MTEAITPIKGAGARGIKRWRLAKAAKITTPLIMTALHCVSSACDRTCQLWYSMLFDVRSTTAFDAQHHPSCERTIMAPMPQENPVTTGCGNV